MTYITMGDAVDLTNVKFVFGGQTNTPVAVDNAAQTVSYAISVDGGKRYGLSETNFDWPTFTTNYTGTYWDGSPTSTQITYHWLSYAGFHNAVATLTIYVRQPVPGKRTVIKGTDAGHTSWQLSLSPTNEIANLIPADLYSFATGVVNRISGFGTTGWLPIPCFHETGTGRIWPDPPNANMQRPYNIALDKLIGGLQYAKTHANDNYDLDNYNCTDFALGVASHCGANIISKLGRWPTCPGHIPQYNFGHDPGDLGQDLYNRP